MGHAGLIAEIISQGGELFLKNRKGQTPVMLAESLGKAEAVQAMYHSHARRQIPKDEFILMKAVKENQIPLAEALIEEGASPGMNGGILLHVAESPEMVKLLIKSGVPVEAAGKDGRSPLHSAVARRHPNVAIALLESGADPNHRADDGTTPFRLVQDANEDFLKPLRELMKQRGGIAIRGEALHQMASEGNAQGVKELLDAGTDPNATDEFMRTPLHLAAARGDLEIVRLLVAAGANLHLKQIPEKPGISDMTPLHLSVLNKHAQVAEFLLDHGADIDAVCQGSDTPLVIACRNADQRLVDELLKRNADPNGGTSVSFPLLYAVQTGDLEFVKKLITSGADTGRKSDRGYLVDIAPTVKIRRHLWELGAPSGNSQSKNRCHICGVPFFSGGYVISLSDGGSIAETCFICGKGVCDLCSRHICDEYDNASKICQTCRARYGLNKDHVLTFKWLQAVTKLADPAPESEYACPVCGKKYTVKYTISEMPRCKTCNRFHCVSCGKEVIGENGKWECCSLCAKR
ncbi:MAG TPA: ankyrin repeat domain-containing protein, partial [Candidatus Ozemobacteraceae bacterium]|nr:ankyrin repeat domain-containing protein [Candidatus Ozemobacteraceae bacterium]